MAFIVTDACKGCKYSDCVEVCPVDCFHEDTDMLVINPDICIDCGACIPVCPVNAIYEESEVPKDQKEWIQINAERSQNLPVITEMQEPLKPYPPGFRPDAISD